MNPCGVVASRCIVVLGFLCAAMVGDAAKASATDLTGERIFVLAIKASGVEDMLAQNLSEIALQTIRATAKTSAIVGQSEIDSMLAIEKQKDLLGCETNVTCLAEIGGALGANQLVVGSLGKIGSVFLLSMKRIDTNRAEVLRHISEEVTDDEDTLLEATRQVSAALFDAPGTLGLGYLDVFGEGVVHVDGREIGNAPLLRLPVALGAHTVELKRSLDGSAIVRKRVLVKRFATVRVEPEEPRGGPESPPVRTEEPDTSPTARDGWFTQAKVGMSVIVQNTVDSQHRSITGPTLLDAQTLAGYAWQPGVYVFGAFSVSKLSRLLEMKDSQNTNVGEYDDVTVPPTLLGLGGGVGYSTSGKLRVGASLSVQRSVLLDDVYGLAEFDPAIIGEDRLRARELLGNRGDMYWNIRPAVDVGLAVTEHLYLGVSMSAPLFVGNGDTVGSVAVAGVAGFAAPPASTGEGISPTRNWRFWTAAALVAAGAIAAGAQAAAAAE